MKLYPDGAIEGSPQEIIAYQALVKSVDPRKPTPSDKGISILSTSTRGGKRIKGALKQPTDAMRKKLGRMLEIAHAKGIPMFLGEGTYPFLHLKFKNQEMPFCGKSGDGQYVDDGSRAYNACGTCIKAADKMERENQERLKAGNT
jgi:hypothetical protein